jgi:hypothetical protein
MSFDVGTLTGHLEIEDSFSSGLDLAQEKLTKFAELFEGMLGDVALGGAALIGIIGGISAAIVGLADKGSEINDVRENFDRLAGGIEHADDVLVAMRQGTAGTISDLSLMTSANKLLQSGVAANAETFKTLTDSARVLSREGFGTVSDVLDQLNRGMETGLLRGPLLKSLHIDLTAAEQAYALKLGLTSDELTKQQKVQADRAAMLRGLSSIVASAGEQELTLSERLKQGGVAIENWFSQLASGVASSSHVSAAFDAIGKAITDNFGGAGQTAIQVLTDWVNKFADAVAYYGPKVIEWVRALIDDIETIYSKIRAYWDTVPDWFKRIATDAAIAGGATVLVSKGLSDVTSGDTLSALANMAQIWSSISDYIGKAATALKEFGLAGVLAKLPGLSGGLGATAIGAAGVGAGLGLVWAKEWLQGIFSNQNFKDFQDDIAAVLSDTPRNKVGKPTYETSISVVGHLATAPPTPSEPLSQSVIALIDKLKGIDAAKEIRDISTALRELGGTSIGQAQFMDLGKMLEDAVSKGAALTPALKAVYAQYVDMKSAIKDAAAEEQAWEAGRKQNWAELDKFNSSYLQSLAAQRDAVHTLNAVAIDEAIAGEQAKMAATTSSLQQRWAAQDRYYALLHQKEDEDYRFAVEKINKQYDELERDNDLAVDSLEASRKKALEAADAMHHYTETKTDVDQLNTSLQRTHARYGDTILDLQNVDRQARETYDSMILQDEIYFATFGEHLYSFDQLKAKLNDVEAAHAELFAHTHPGWMKTHELITTVGEALQNLGQTIGGLTGAALSGIGSLMTSFDQWIQRAQGLAKQLTAVQQVQGLLAGVGAVWAGTSSPNKTASVVGGALSGASTGMMFGPYGAAVGAAVGALTGYVRAMHQAEEMQRGLDQQLEKMHDTATSTYGSWEGMMQRAQQLGVNVGDATGSSMHHSSEDIGRVRDQLTDLAAAEQKLVDLSQKYGLTFADMDPVHAFQAATKAAHDLLANVQLLTNAGYSYDSILKGMSGDLNDWLTNALKAGIKIPAAMEPILQKLIETKQISEENASLLLGLGDKVKPTFQEITEAADRYGLKLADLGTGVQQIRMDETAAQIAKDFDTLSRAGAPLVSILHDTQRQITDTGIDFSTMSDKAQRAYLDAGGVLTTVTLGMHKQIQDIILDSLHMGTQVPANLKPIVQQMIDLGGDNGLVDQFGNKLTSTSQLNWETPLTDKIDELIKKLGELIDKIAGPSHSATSAVLDWKSAMQDAMDPNKNGAAAFYDWWFKQAGDANTRLPGPPNPFPHPQPVPEPAPGPGDNAGGNTRTGATNDWPINNQVTLNVDGQTYLRIFKTTVGVLTGAQ